MQKLPSVLQAITNSGHHFPYISEISAADKVLLNNAVQQVRPESKYYEDSWGYIIQATRYGQCKWYDPITDSLIFFGRKTTSPELVVSVFFASPEYLKSVLKKLLQALNIHQAILKNANPENISDFLPYGFRQYRAEECWSTLYPLRENDQY